MKKMFLALVAVALASVSLLAQEVAQPAKSAWIPAVDVNVSYASRYMSDGVIVNPESMFFGDLTLSWNVTDDFGVYANIWAALDGTDYRKGSWPEHPYGSKINKDVEEVDYTVGAWYYIPNVPVLKELTIDLSYAYWDYPKRAEWDGVGETQNILDLVLTAGAFSPVEKLTLVPSFKIRCDYENSEWQFTTKVAASYPLCEKLTLNGAASLFFENARYAYGSNWYHYPHGDPRDSFTRVLLEASLDYQVCEHFTIAPFVKLSQTVSEAYRKRGYSPKESIQNKKGLNDQWGVKLSASF